MGLSPERQQQSGSPSTSSASYSRDNNRRGSSRRRKGSKAQGNESKGNDPECDTIPEPPAACSRAAKSSSSSRFAAGCSTATEREEKASSSDKLPRECSRGPRTGPVWRNGVENFCLWCKSHAHAFYNNQKPQIDVFVMKIIQWRTRARSLAGRAWPPLRQLLIIVGGISLTLAFAWLNCVLNGFKSLVRLGSAAFFMIACCSTLCLGCLGGFFKLLVALVISVAAVVFLGYMPGLIIFAVFSGVILWLYGSFWVTGGTLLVGVVFLIVDRPRLSLLLGLIYSGYSMIKTGGLFTFVICLNLAFISSSIMIYFLQSNSTDNSTPEFAKGTSGQSNKDHKGDKNHANFKGTFEGHASGASKSAFTSESEVSAVDREVERVLSCKDHYAVLELSRFAEIDLTTLKRDYRKKAMLVHPDKNLGNTVAEEAFKRLQNAYEVLLDPSKKQGYDEELKKEEMFSVLKQFQQDLFRNGRAGTSHDWRTSYEEENDDSVRRIMCKKCNKPHRWICTNKTKSRARWCQECQDHHQAKDGDGWIEQRGHVFFFGMFQKVDPPRAYACADSQVYEVTEWVQCQGMNCIPNTHKPSFHVSTSGIFKSQSKGPRSNKPTHSTAADDFPFAQMNENMTEEEFMRWLENAMASGMFGDTTEATDQPDARGSSCTKPSKKKKKGRNKW